MESELGGVKFGRDINLIPFKDMLHMTSVLNIVMFIPIGFLQGFVIKNSWKKSHTRIFAEEFVIPYFQKKPPLFTGYMV